MSRMVSKEEQKGKTSTNQIFKAEIRVEVKRANEEAVRDTIKRAAFEEFLLSIIESEATEEANAPAAAAFRDVERLRHAERQTD